MSEAQQQDFSSIDQLLDASMDEISNAPEFMNPPNGAYLCTVKKVDTKAEVGKEGEKRRAVRLIFTIDSVVELADTNETPPPVGAMFSQTFGWDAKAAAEEGPQAGWRWLKGAVKGVSDQLALPKMSDTLAVLEGKKVTIALTLNDGKYVNIKTLLLAE